MKSLVVWSPEDARRSIWRGDAPAGMRIHGNLDLANSSSVKCLPPHLQAVQINVSGCRNLKSLPAGLRCQDLTLARCDIEWLPPDLQVSRWIDARDCRRLRLVPACA